MPIVYRGVHLMSGPLDKEEVLGDSEDVLGESEDGVTDLVEAFLGSPDLTETRNSLVGRVVTIRRGGAS